MAQEGTLVVEGLKPLLHDFNRLSKTTTKRLRDALRTVAAPVAIDAKFRERDNILGTAKHPHNFGARTVSGIRVVVRQRGISVDQTRRKSADLQRRRGNFGDLQMRKAFIPALEDNAGVVERRMEEVLGQILDGGVL